MIYNTQTFWSYICNEGPFIINQAKDILTRKEYDFDTKKYNIRKFYQSINKIEIDGIEYESIRFPTGLIPFILKKLPLEVEIKEPRYKLYTEQEVLDYANIVKDINPSFEIRDYQIEACLASLNNFQSLIHSSVGSGKEQPCDIIIPTPEGFKKFGTLKPGDVVFGKNGKSQKVIGIYPQGMKDVYRISFQNGASVECGLEHLWTIRKNRGKNKTVTLKDIKDNYYKIDKRGFKRYLYSVDYIEPVEYQQKNYFIDPYLLGILIGDGTLTTENIGFSCPNTEIEIVQKIRDLLPKTYHLQPNLYPTCPQYYIRMSTSQGKGKFNLYKKEIERLKLNVKSHLKFIPEEYLLGSIQQRKELLAGLLDADGCCRKRVKSCSITYGTTSERLAKDVQQLVFSLGGAATIRSYKRKNRNKEYEVCIELLFNPFYLTRKRNNYIPYLINNTIINIEKIRKAECMCIKVSNEDELYITQNYIPTHNTSVMSLVCKILENDKILILNGNNIILQQIYDRLISFGITDVSWNPSKEPDYTKSIVLINARSSDERLNKQDEAYLDFLQKVNTFVVDECFEGNTEILTNTGWKKFQELTGNELFANFNAETKEIYFTSGKLIKRLHTEKCIKWKVHRKSSIILTPKHQQLYYHNDLPIKCNIQDLKFYNNGNYIACSGKGIGKDKHLTNLERILIALQADGCATQKNDRHCYHIGFYKQRKIKRWLELLKAFDGKVVELKPLVKNNKITRRWHIWLPEYSEAKAKYLNKCFDLTTFSQEKAVEFIEEIKQWDGFKQSENITAYISQEKSNTDFVSAVATLAGYSAYQEHGKDNRNNYKDWYRVFLSKQYKKVLQNCKKEEIDYNDYVYCVEVPEHNIIVRGSGDKQYTFISGNCQHMQALTNFEPIFYMDEINLKHIIGYSGSPFRNYDHPYNNADDFTLIAIIGEPAFSYEMKDTIEDQNIAQPYSYFINYRNKEAWLPDHLKDNYFVQYRMNITHNKARNRAGIEMLKFLNKFGVKTLASINNIKPGQNLMKTLKEEGVASIFVCGDNTVYEWKPTRSGKLKLYTEEGGVDNIKQAFEKGYNIIFGSTVMDEGVDIADFQAVVLFSGGKTPIAGIQRVGRASRKKKTGKNISFVIDFKDIGGASIFQNQYEKRKKMMKDCGVINIEKVQDFCKMIEELNSEIE